MARIDRTAHRRTRQGRATPGGVTVPPDPLATAILALSPVGYWKLDEASGNALNYGSVGSGADGVYTGTVTRQGTAGPGGNYPTFAGGYVAVPDNAAWSMNTASGLTVFACINPSSVASSGRNHIVAKSTSGGYEWEFKARQGVNGRLGAEAFDSAGAQVVMGEAHDSLTTGWQAVAFAGPTPSYPTRMSLYRNGSSPLAAAHTGTGAGAGYANGTGAVWIGYRADSPASQQWAGSIAHLAIYAGRLSDAQVGALMASADNDGWF